MRNNKRIQKLEKTSKDDFIWTGTVLLMKSQNDRRVNQQDHQRLKDVFTKKGTQLFEGNEARMSEIKVVTLASTK